MRVMTEVEAVEYLMESAAALPRVRRGIHQACGEFFPLIYPHDAVLLSMGLESCGSRWYTPEKSTLTFVVSEDLPDIQSATFLL